MMTNNQSGIKGMLKVAFSLTLAASLSLIFIQCNSKVDQEASANSEFEAFIEKYKVETINLEKDQDYVLVGSDTVWRIPEFSIANDQLRVNGKPCEIAEIKSFVKNVIPHGLVKLKIDRNQSMKKVKEVQKELRRLNKRKVVYYGETTSGEQMIQPFLFAPLHWAIPHSDALAPQIDMTNATMEGNVATLNGVEYLNLNLSNNAINYKEEVYQFVKNHVSKGSLAYVIKAEFDETDTFENYLTNLAEVFQGFEKVYQAHAKNLYDKDYNELKILEKVEVSKATPKAVYIAES